MAEVREVDHRNAIHVLENILVAAGVFTFYCRINFFFSNNHVFNIQFKVTFKIVYVWLLTDDFLKWREFAPSFPFFSPLSPSFFFLFFFNKQAKVQFLSELLHFISRSSNLSIFKGQFYPNLKYCHFFGKGNIIKAPQITL